MLRFFISLLTACWCLCLNAEELFTLRVWLSDKDECEFSLLHPNDFLSERSIARHKRDKINVSDFDLPVSKRYKDVVLSLSERLICHSNWLNTLVVECKEAKIKEVESLPFVKCVEVLHKGEVVKSNLKSDFYNIGNIKRHPVYGVSKPISDIVGTTPLHKRGYWGEDVFIAVLDDGFGGVDTLSQWFDINKIIFSYDVVNPKGDIYREDDHGTAVLSIMLANCNGEYIGIAPQSDYALIRTEDIGFEAPFEEDFFVRGLEIADSLGVDIVNASLGYEQWGEITAISCLATEIATKKGIKVVTSCGNKGDGGFSHPADANGVIAVGGIDKKGKVIDFSSKELVNDKYVSPKTRALASDVPIIDGSGKIMSAYGTSFAAPAITGSIAVKKSF